LNFLYFSPGYRKEDYLQMRQRVLVVDDDHLVADTLRMVFVVNGFESEACYSATDALQRARSFVPELLLCDIAMPGLDGLQLAAAISREIPNCQMIMLTAYLSSAASVELEALRMKRPLRLLSKPCRPEVLLKEAGELLGRQELCAAS
jgi:CheY-like chemotaxis protein